MSDYDVVIIGAGPAGLTAAIYTSRANLRTVFIEKGAPGGKMVETSVIENWSGDESVAGHELATRMLNHAKKTNAEYMYGDVEKVVSIGEFQKEVYLSDGRVINTKTVIIATGTVENKPMFIDGILKYEHKGVSYCAICDGPFFKNKPVAVIGGGNSAIEEASYLTSIASKVYVFVRKDYLRADKVVQEEANKKKNLEIIYKSNVKKIEGKDGVQNLIVNIDGDNKNFKVSALFPYIGQKPSTSFLSNLNITNDLGYIKTSENMETSIDNIFAIGDVRVKQIRQIATAVADGAIVGKILANIITK